jgi:hypothetical protein
LDELEAELVFLVAAVALGLAATAFFTLSVGLAAAFFGFAFSSDAFFLLLPSCSPLS